MSISRSAPGGEGTGPAPSDGRAVPTSLVLLACAAQAFVLFATSVMGLGWAGPTYVAALVQAGLAFLVITRLAARGRRTVVLVPLLSAALTAGLVLAGTAQARAAACEDRVLAAAQQLAPLPGTTADFEGHEVEGCLASTRTELPEQAVLRHYERELTRLGWRLTPERTQTAIGTAADKDGVSVSVDITPADGTPVPSTLEVVVGDADGPAPCVLNAVDGALQRTPTTAVHPGTWSMVVSTEQQPASVVVRDSTSAVVFEQPARRRPGTSDDTLRDPPQEVDALALEPGSYQVECRPEDDAATTLTLEVAWDSPTAQGRATDVVVRLFPTPDHWR